MMMSWWCPSFLPIPIILELYTINPILLPYKPLNIWRWQNFFFRFSYPSWILNFPVPFLMISRSFSILIISHDSYAPSPGKSLGQRSLVGSSPWGHKNVAHDLRLNTHTHTHIYTYTHTYIILKHPFFTSEGWHDTSRIHTYQLKPMVIFIWTLIYQSSKLQNWDRKPKYRTLHLSLFKILYNNFLFTKFNMTLSSWIW